MISHLSFGVADLARSIALYDALRAPLGGHNLAPPTPLTT